MSTKTYKNKPGIVRWQVCPVALRNRCVCVCALTRDKSGADKDVDFQTLLGEQLQLCFDELLGHLFSVATLAFSRLLHVHLQRLGSQRLKLLQGCSSAGVRVCVGKRSNITSQEPPTTTAFNLSNNLLAKAVWQEHLKFFILRPSFYINRRALPSSGKIQEVQQMEEICSTQGFKIWCTEFLKQIQEQICGLLSLHIHKQTLQIVALGGGMRKKKTHTGAYFWSAKPLLLTDLKLNKRWACSLLKDCS